MITREDAETIPISRAVRVLAKSYSPEEGERLQILYKRLRGIIVCYYTYSYYTYSYILGFDYACKFYLLVSSIYHRERERERESDRERGRGGVGVGR